MQETETIDQVQSKDSLAEKKESSEGSGLLSSIDHNVTDAYWLPVINRFRKLQI